MGLQLILAKITGLSFTNLYALKFLLADISLGVPLPLCSAVQEFMSRITLWHQSTLHIFVRVCTFPFEELHSVNFRAPYRVYKRTMCRTQGKRCVSDIFYTTVSL